MCIIFGMSQISLKNISKSFYSKVVLDEVQLQVNPGDKIAIVGENGSGKTTLFRIIMGLEKSDHENTEIVIAKNTMLGYLEQHLQENPEQKDALFDPEIFELEQKIHDLAKKLSQKENRDNPALLAEYDRLTARFESLDGYHYQHRLAEILSGLGIDLATAQRPLQELSGGERMRVALARLLIKEPDIMLLDEPTNHLDHVAIEWLENFLSSTKSSVLVISHDRLFIDRIANKTAELSHGKLTVYNGNYSAFIAQKKAQEKTLQGEIKKLESTVNRQNQITQTMLSHRKISSYHSSQKKAEKLGQRLAELRAMKSKPNTTLKFKITQGIQLGDPDKVILETKALSVTFPNAEEPLFKPFSFTLRGREKVVIVGRNGCGKTTLLRSLLGEEKAASGNVSLTKDIRFGVLGQIIHFENELINVLESLQENNPSLTDGQARNILATFGFTGIQVFKSLSALSGGERSRLYLCHLLQKKPDVLFLDEPTNHLDIYSCEILENALSDFAGAVLAVSHDRYFIDKIADYLLGFTGKEIHVFSDYDSFKEAEQIAIANTQSNAKDLSRTIISDEISSQNSPEKASENLWTEEELDLQKNLVNYPTLPNNQVQLRKLKAALEQAIKELDEKMKVCADKKTEMELQFQTATSPDIYVRYNHLLALNDKYENLYLKIDHLLESIF